ncbi:MAG: hydrogenase maturation protease [Melioribacteraceae bacterium]|nr:hydrogenase maturation protease [Melioribacteraceae bacterium]
MLKIIGLGNSLRGDDGIGPVIINQLADYNFADNADNVILINAESDIFIILEHIIEGEPILIIDCAKMGLTPGSVKKFEINKKTISTVDKFISLHGFGFGEIYNMALKMGSAAPCKIIGVEPKSIEFNSPLSDEVRNCIPQIINLVNEEVCSYV